LSRDAHPLRTLCRTATNFASDALPSFEKQVTLSFARVSPDSTIHAMAGMPPTQPTGITNSTLDFPGHTSCSIQALSGAAWSDFDNLRIERSMLHGLAILTLLLTFADHWTTYLCLRAPIEGWQVVEANPAVELLFRGSGLIGGLMIDSAFTIFAVGFILYTQRFQTRIKETFLAFIVVTTGYAVVNNLGAISALGISPLGFS
jgi:hypothetical protein